jgi:hypothetical protein
MQIAKAIFRQIKGCRPRHGPQGACQQGWHQGARSPSTTTAPASQTRHRRARHRPRPAAKAVGWPLLCQGATRWLHSGWSKRQSGASSNRSGITVLRLAQPMPRPRKRRPDAPLTGLTVEPTAVPACPAARRGARTIARSPSIVRTLACPRRPWHDVFRHGVTPAPTSPRRSSPPTTGVSADVARLWVTLRERHSAQTAVALLPASAPTGRRPDSNRCATN